MAKLSTHILDTANGKPAAGVKLALYRLDNASAPELLTKRVSNADGRTDTPLLSGDALATGKYRLTFHAGDYFRALGQSLAEPRFVDVVNLDFGLSDATGNYHVPLLVSPWSYSTYRGS